MRSKPLRIIVGLTVLSLACAPLTFDLLSEALFGGVSGCDSTVPPAGREACYVVMHYYDAVARGDWDTAAGHLDRTLRASIAQTGDQAAWHPAGVRGFRLNGDGADQRVFDTGVAIDGNATVWWQDGRRVNIFVHVEDGAWKIARIDAVRYTDGNTTPE